VQCLFLHYFCIGGVQVEFKQIHHLIRTFLLDFVSNTPILLTFPLLPVPELIGTTFLTIAPWVAMVRRYRRVWFLGFSNVIEVVDDKSISVQLVATSLGLVLNCCVYWFLCASILHIDRNIAIIGGSRYVYRKCNEP
jgi:hypothetical protein